MNKTDILNLLREYKKELQTNFGIQEIALFGSYARDEQHKDSDIDLVIIKIDKKDYFNRIQAKYFLEEKLKKKVDLGYFDTIRNFLKKRIEKELIYA
jgi:predicted nucleotidyltransferase